MLICIIYVICYYLLTHHVLLLLNYIYAHYILYLCLFIIIFYNFIIVDVPWYNIVKVYDFAIKCYYFSFSTRAKQ